VPDCWYNIKEITEKDGWWGKQGTMFGFEGVLTQIRIKDENRSRS